MRFFHSKLRVVGVSLVFLFAAMASVSAQSRRQPPAFHITAGVVDDQVLQRDSNDRADIALSGLATSRGAATVESRVLRRHRLVEGFDWAEAASVGKGGEWQASIKGLALGGPYDIEFRLLDKKGATLDATRIRNLLVGDLWILAGQSNMQGVGNLENVEPTNELVHSFNMMDEWGVAEEPLHYIPDAVDAVHWRSNEQGEPERLRGEKAAEYRKNRTKGAGLGLPFANRMVRWTGVPIGLVPCAHGGTSMSQWDPALKDQGGKSLYGAMLRRFRAVGGKVSGVLWYQGESDANREAAPFFADRFTNLIQSIRSDFAQPELPFYYVQLGRYVSSQPRLWNAIQEDQRQAERQIPRVGMVGGVDLPLDDPIHIGTGGLKVLGHRLANLACHDLFPQVSRCTRLKRGPRPARVILDRSESVLRVEFSEVNGRLRSRGRISGFSLRKPDGTEIPAFYRARIDPASRKTVVLKFRGELPEDAVLWYGWGLDPYCNLTDRANMAAPVFGPMEIQ